MPTVKPNTQWRQLKWNSLIRLTEHPNPKLRWRWQRCGKKLYLVTPAGKVWLFKLKYGCWIRPYREFLV